jgi:hypothetical protein
MGLVGALMAIPVGAALKVVLTEQLHARDAADASTGTPGDGEAAVPPAPAGEAQLEPAPATMDHAALSPGRSPGDGGTVAR